MVMALERWAIPCASILQRPSKGIVNLSRSELFERVTRASKPLKVRDPPQAKNLHRVSKTR
jgi:hypothetical protein